MVSVGAVAAVTVPPIITSSIRNVPPVPPFNLNCIVTGQVKLFKGKGAAEVLTAAPVVGTVTPLATVVPLMITSIVEGPIELLCRHTEILVIFAT